MVPAPSTVQKSLSQQKIKRVKKHGEVLKEIRQIRKSNLMYVNKLPYKHLLKVFSKDLKELCDEGESTVNVLHEASQAYLAGIFEGYSNVCQSVAKKESTNFLLCLASLGLKKLISLIANDKSISKAAKESDHHFHRNSLVPHLEDMEHHHNHHHDNQQEHNHHHHNHQHDPQEEHNHHHHQHHEHEGPSHHHHHRSQQGNNDNIDAVIRNIMRRISSNVTVSVSRD